PFVQDNEATLSFAIDGLGFGAVLATDQYPATGPLKDLLAFMADRSKRPLSSYSRDWKAVPQTMVETPATKAPSAPPPGMIRIPDGDYDFQVRGIEIEGGNDPGVDIQYPWEDIPRRSHRHRMHLAGFY